MTIQKELETALTKILKVPQKKIASDGTGPFNAFKTAVTKAAAEAKRTEETLENIMSVVSERREVLSFLIQFYAAKKMYRKQIMVTITSLLEIDSWRQDMKEDRELMGLLPEEMHDLLEGDPTGSASVAKDSSLTLAPAVAEAAAAPASPRTGAAKVATRKTQAELTPQQRETIQRELESAMQKILAQGAGSNDAFNSFKKAVTKAEREKSLYAYLEPKDDTYAFLLEVYESKKMYRKQVEQVFGILLSSGGWIMALQANQELLSRLPAELSQMEKDALMEYTSNAMNMEEDDEDDVDEVAIQEFDEPAPRTSGRAKEKKKSEPDVDIRAAVEAAKEANRMRQSRAQQQSVVGQSKVSDPAEVLLEAHYMVLALVSRAGSAAKAADIDDGGEAFDAFRRAVTSAAKIRVNNQLVVNELNPKKPVITFMFQLHEQKQKYRSRINNLMQILMTFPDWSHELKTDRQLKKDLEAMYKRTEKIVRTGGGAAVNLTKRARELNAQGYVGVVCVRILSGSNLTFRNQFESSDPFVLVSIGYQCRQTKVIPNNLDPVWKENVMLFDVKSTKERLHFQVVDGSLGNEVRMGHLDLHPWKYSTNLNEPQWHQLEGVRHGELEFELTYEGEEPDEVDFQSTIEGAMKPEASQQAQTAMTLLSQAIDMLSVPEAGEQVQIYQNSELRCPNGHPVTKKKAGLHWHQLVEYMWTQQTCNLCQRVLETSEVRWRCANHCDFDVCESCYDEVHFGTGEIRLQDRTSFMMGESRRSLHSGAVSGPIVRTQSGVAPTKESSRNLARAPSSRTAGKSYRQSQKKKHQAEAVTMKQPQKPKEKQPPLTFATDTLDISEIDMPEEGIEDRGDIIFFAVDVLAENDGPPWRVWRRFHDFMVLADRLGQRAKTYEDAPFPPKLLRDEITEEDLEIKRDALEVWLRKMIHRNPMPQVWERPLQEFCGHTDPTELFEPMPVGATFHHVD